MIDGLPVPLRWRPAAPPSSRSGDRSLEISAPGDTDLFIDPGGAAAALGAPRATGTPTRDFMLQPAGAAEAAEVGFLAQSPTGPGCTASFDQIAFVPERLADLRRGE